MSDIYKNFERAELGAGAFAKHILLPWLVISALAWWVGSFGADEHAVVRRLVLVGFFSIYFLLVRAGIHYMSAGLHAELKKEFGEKYEALLAGHHDFGLFGLKLGSTLAQMKRALHLERARKQQKRKEAFR